MTGIYLPHNDILASTGELYHHGTKGQKWGVRRYQNPDGSLTDEGRRRYGKSSRQTRLENSMTKSLEKKRALGAKADEYIDKHGEGSLSLAVRMDRMDRALDRKTSSYIKKYGSESFKQYKADHNVKIYIDMWGDIRFD